MVTVGAWPPPSLDCREADGPQRCAVLAAIPRDPAHAVATLAYQAFAANDFPRAAIEARRAVAYAPDNREYALLLVNALYRAGQFVEAEQAADAALAIDSEDAALVAQRGFIRRKLGKEALARGDFDSALRLGGLPVNTEIGLLADLGRKADARRRFDAARVDGSLVKLAPAELAYLAARAGDDEQALAAFDRADAAGSLPGSAYQDAAYAALRMRRDARAIAYFRRSLEDTEPLQLRAETQLHFNTRRAISEVSREGGVIASLSYRGAVSGLGPTSATRAGSDNLQAGVEGYWRPWGYLNGRPVELFARAFQSLYARGDGTTGGDTLQSAVGIRRKLLTDINLIASLSRVFTPSGRRDDWLAQLGYSGGTGGDLRVDAPSWWTSRISAEAGRYFIARQSYALASIEAGRTFRPDADAAWTVFPHLVIAGDYDSAAEVKRAFGIGPGIGWRYWFRADQYHAPRSYFDVTLDYRFRIRGAERERGLFLVGTLSY
jgi:tetratricopeptide (TPR) repeat protein